MTQLVVAGAIVSDRRLLLAQRSRPAHLAGLWELPGGKVETGETVTDALRRELAEELDVDVAVYEQIGGPVEPAPGVSVIALRAVLVTGTPVEREHLAVRWVDADGLDRMSRAGEMVPADRAWIPDLRTLLLG